MGEIAVEKFIMLLDKVNEMQMTMAFLVGVLLVVLVYEILRYTSKKRQERLEVMRKLLNDKIKGAGDHYIALKKMGN